MAEVPKVDHLLLLVGGNPLPNAVAGVLLLRDGGTITLIYSEQTKSVKDRLERWLRRAIPFRIDIRSKKVKEADPYEIYLGVKAALQQVNAPLVGLHYTGGTKAMSTHAYLAIEQWRVDRSDATFVASYLDSRTLNMVFDPASPESGQKSSTNYVGLMHSFDLVEDLLYLHGWELLCPVNQQPILPLTTKALVDVHTNYTKRSEWYHWLKEELNRKWKDQTETWRSAELPRQQSKFARLTPVTQALQQELNLDGNELHATRAAHLFHPCPEKLKKDGTPETAEELFHKWLKGCWLENYVLQVLQLADLGLHVYQGVETKNPQFEVDVVATCGYQLFLFSCTTQTDKGTRRELKLKLLEASVRAAQLGGDEARVALVCCADDAKGLQNEMRLSLESNHIRVFGLEQLADLGMHLANWIRTESKERKQP